MRLLDLASSSSSMAWLIRKHDIRADVERNYTNS
ncbi:uncharacterized protein G2W53_043537 [Senna tora]|uniref:Uncharacterized protein n=1 Tax=Senna tora TaxID=362788 RepID=A0A834W3H8_9FABA|nr:uncharacterized protein G2W53_043537 [Senna tora]